MRTRELISSAGRIGLGSLAVALLTLVGYRTHLELASAIPLFLLIVVVQSLTGDFVSSSAISVLSAACLEFFFTRPYFSLYIRDFSDILPVVAFLFTALVVTRLMSRVREEAATSRLEHDRLHRLWELSQQLLALQPDAVMTEKFLEPFRQYFGVVAICTFDGAGAELRLVGESKYRLGEKTRSAFIAAQDLRDPVLHISVRCLRLGGRTVGTIGFEGLDDPEQTTGSLAALTAALIERTRAFREASTAEAGAQAEVYRSAMLDALAHEFKTPLATILTAAGGIREAGPLVPEQMDLTDTVESEAVRLANLTSRLLRTARLDREDIKPRMDLIEIGPLATHIAEQYTERSPERRILVRNSGPASEILADPELLQIALSQLVENACKYSQPGSTVTVETGREADFIVASVSNTGSVIPYSERYKVFDRFFRGATARNSTAGTGLGLYIARKIALAHGGDLELETPDPAGDRVTFCLKIPIAKEAPAHVLTAK